MYQDKTSLLYEPKRDIMSGMTWDELTVEEQSQLRSLMRAKVVNARLNGKKFVAVSAVEEILKATGWDMPTANDLWFQLLYENTRYERRG